MEIRGCLNSFDQSQIDFFDGMDCKPDISPLDHSFLDLSDEDLGVFLYKYTREELDEIDRLMLEQLMSEQQELHRMRLINQLNHDLHFEDDCMFLMVPKQEQSSPSLNKCDGTLNSNKEECSSSSQPQEENWENDRWSQRFSIEQLSDEASSIESQTLSDSNKSSQELESKSRHCRHFLKGYCMRGDSCGFRHDKSVFSSDLQKVFLEGLPPKLNSSSLRKKLAELGYTVLNNPKVMRWYAPNVCLGSVEEAQRLLEKGAIVMDQTVVRVRPFEARSSDNKKKQPDETERSVFLGGLRQDTTPEMIRDELRKMGLVVVNIPVLKCGYSPQVILETYHQARTLIELTKVQINGVSVSVRPFANIRTTYGKKKKRTKSPASKPNDLQCGHRVEL